MIAGSPLAFGEGNTKSRIKNILNYKKPAFWMVVAAVAAVIVAGACLLANPKEAAQPKVLVSEIMSAEALNMRGIREEIPAEDFDNICELVTLAKDITKTDGPANTTSEYGIYITTKGGDIIAITESSGDMLFQRDGKSWIIDDSDLASFVHDVCAVDAEAPEEPQSQPLPSGVSASIPDEFIRNEAGATDEEVSAIFAVEKDRYNIEAIARQDVYLYIYARQEWHSGALLLAGLSPMGETPAELYFISGGKAIMLTNGSDVWSINYTHYKGETFVFGKSFAWDNGPLATDEVKAEFWNGETVSTPMKYIPNDKKDISRGYICATPSVTWLKSLKILADGRTVADDGNDQFLFSPVNEPWYGEAESIRNRTRYVLASDALTDGHTSIIDFFGGYPSVTVKTPYESEPTATNPLIYWPDCPEHEGISPDIWHSNNGLHEMVGVIAGSRITADVIEVSESYEFGEKVSDLPVSQAYWVDLSVKDDARCISRGELVCPTKEGYYILILVTDYGCFSQTVQVS